MERLGRPSAEYIRSKSSTAAPAPDPPRVSSAGWDNFGHQGVGRNRRDHLSRSRSFAWHERPPHSWYPAPYHHPTRRPHYFNTLPGRQDLAYSAKRQRPPVSHAPGRFGALCLPLTLDSSRLGRRQARRARIVRHWCIVSSAYSLCGDIGSHKQTWPLSRTGP